MGFHKWLATSRSWRALKPLAREHRGEPTSAEELLWNVLRGRKVRSIRFPRQHAIGSYIVDFFCAEHRLVVELDGASHDSRAAEDEYRTKELAARDFQVIRFTNEEVLSNIDIVLAQISQAVEACKTHPR